MQNHSLSERYLQLERQLAQKCNYIMKLHELHHESMTSLRKDYDKEIETVHTQYIEKISTLQKKK